MKDSLYIGRFAPSPTGNVHFGTLVAAVASYLQAQKHKGLWKLRIDDIDTPRTVKSSALDIIKTLEAYGFQWHGNIYYQSKHIDDYEDAFQQLKEKSLLFPCTCSRKQLQSQITKNKVYPGTCRQKIFSEVPDEYAVRIKCHDAKIDLITNNSFTDKLMGKQTQNIAQQCGDFILKRRDGLFAYQLAVVVDDYLQNITEVVRGADLLESTHRQIYLQNQLNYSIPDYLHVPLVLDDDGNKLSKSSDAESINQQSPQTNLFNALKFLKLEPPTALKHSEIDEIWDWTTTNWLISG